MTNSDQTKHLQALDTIKKKLTGKSLNYREIYTLMDEISHNRMSDVLTAYFVASGFKDGFSPDELFHLTKAMVETGTKLHFPGIVADKHSIGGLSGTRASMIIVPIIAAAGFVMPKTSSRAITSPAGTADVMETIAQVNFSPDQITDIVKKVGGCIVWGGHLGIAPADDILIRVEEPLSFESFDKVIMSIMAKKIAVSANHLILDIPIGRTMKIRYLKDAEMVSHKFIEISKRFGITVETDINHADQPAGNAIGPYLEAIDVMRVLEQTQDRPLELEKRSVRLAGKLLNLCYKTKGYAGDGGEDAKQLLTSGKALHTFREILQAQKGDPDITSSRMRPHGKVREVRAEKSGTIRSINNYHLSAICKILGAPSDKYAGMILHARKGDSILAGDVVMQWHSSHLAHLDEASDTLPNFPVMEIE